MTWKPRHEAHAIDRVRLQFNFSGPISGKILQGATRSTIERSRELGFDFVVPTSSVHTINLQPDGTIAQGKPDPNGVSLKRLIGNDTVEELTFTDTTFAYQTMTYSRWHKLLARLEEVLLVVVRAVEPVNDIASIRLDYWDSFVFGGDPKDADAADLLETLDPAVPPQSLAGSTLWHSHAGWFETLMGNQTLANRNIDVVDQLDSNGETRRVLGVYTLLETRASSNPITIDSLVDRLNEMHRRAVVLFASQIKVGFRDAIGIRLEDYL